MNYFKIDKEDTCNGNGLRATLWLSGCDHHCYNCQNQSTWNHENGKPFNKNAKEELFEILSKSYISGLTLSGGDPLNTWNVSDVYDLVHEVRSVFPEKTIWIYTGYTWEQLHKADGNESTSHTLRLAILQLCDVLVDGEYIDSLRDITLKFRGSKNQRLIDIQKSYALNTIVEIE